MIQLATDLLTLPLIYNLCSDPSPKNSEGCKSYNLRQPDWIPSSEGCHHNLYILRVILDDIINTGQTAICVFVDFHAAFDLVDHGYLLSSLQEHNVPTKLANIVSAIYQHAKTCVRGKTEKFRDVPIH